jgi:hypothetical protein
MSDWISASDPLALVAIQAGQVIPPATEAAAAGTSQLDTPQRSLTLGEPVPIAFGRRRDGYGGILISPGASECRFENDTNNAVTASYLLVLSEGDLPAIEVRDVFQGPCRIGNHSQTYDRRAGTWTPGNYIVERSGYTTPEASYYCGSVGAYPGITTVSFQSTIPDGFDFWKKQVHFFLRGGFQLTRLLDNQYGPSDNFCDLARWMLLNTGRLPASLIDTARLTATAQFLENNGITCNAWITQSSNYLDYLARWAPLFLVCESNVAGKRGLRPILPVTEANQIDTGTIAPVFTFTEDHITPGSLEIEYTSLVERRPFVVQAIWRQQLEDDFSILRTAEVRISGTAEDGPYESHDLSQFCTREDHAVKVSAHILARRVYSSHSARFTARPQANNTAVTQGDIIRVLLARQTNAAGTTYHDYFYQVQRITKTIAGDLTYECQHFPVDDEGRSLISLAVASATGSGILLSSNRSGISCDLNSASDTTVPAETYTSSPDQTVAKAGRRVSISGGSGIEASPGSVGSIGGGGGGGGATNPDDGLDTAYGPHTVIGPTGSPPVAGTGLGANLSRCGTSGAKGITWYRNGVKIVSATYSGGGANVYITYRNPNEQAPSWLSYSEGFIALGVGDAGKVYTSVLECNNGFKTGQTTYVQPGIVARNWGFRFRLGEQWIGGNYTSFGAPPYLGVSGNAPAVIAYNQGGNEFVAAQGEGITDLEVTPL